MPIHRIAVALLLFALSAPSQQVHHVGPGNLPDIDSATAIAAPGDVIMVAPGTYPSFLLQIGVSIIATQPGTVLIDPASASLFGQILHIPSTQTAHLVGIRMARTSVVDGTVTFDQCVIEGVRVGLTVNAGSTHLQNCLLRALPILSVVPGVSAGLEIAGGSVTAVDSIFVGTDSQSYFGGTFGGRPAVWVNQNGSFHGSGLNLTAGLAHPRAAALYSDSGDVLISDSTLRTDPSVCAMNVPAAQCDRCTLIGACPGGNIGTGPLLGVHRPSPLQAGRVFTLEFRTQASAPVLVFGSHGVDRSPYVELAQDFLLDPITCFPAAAMLADSSGHASAAWNVPAAPLPPGSQVWLQGVSGFAMPLQTSPVAGGILQ